MQPFVAFVTLDGIDIREELQVLHWQQLVSARNAIFPDEKAFADQSSFFRGKTLDDIESPAPVSHGVASEPPSGKASDINHSLRRHCRAGSGLSMGDGIFLSSLTDDIKSFRESGYQLCGLTQRGRSTIPASALREAAPPEVVAVDNREGGL